MTFHETILKHLLEYKEINPDFNFLTRQRTTAGRRFESGHWFQGNDGYAFVGLINASGGTNRTRSVGISISPLVTGYSCYLEIVHNEEKDEALIEAYKAIAEKIGVKRIGESKYNLKIGDLTDDDFSKLTSFLDRYYKVIIKEFIKHGRQQVLVTDEKFYKILKKVNEFRLAEPFESIKPDKTVLPLNQILFGPPGTGKTFSLKNDFFELFTISQDSLSKEQYLTNLVSDLTWWQTFAIALYDKGRKTVSDLLEHDIVKAKVRLSNATNIRPIAWSRLQAHTVPECEYVNVKERSEPFLFVKEEDSRWRTVPELVENLYPEGVELVKKIRNYRDTDNEPVRNYVLVTFHQSFSYEDFIEGIKPNLEEGNSSLDFVIKDGVFKTLCLRADKDRGNNYAIFIDEINRGNVSAIFGELITLIEDDKRMGKPQELRVKLPYSKTEFGIPPNLHIIGTMNTADRSVEALDTALRRRFIFKEVMPQPELLKSIEYETFNLQQVLEKINERIEVLLDRDHTIGHSYFIKLESGDIDGLSHVFKNNIIPLLQEYFYNDYEKIALVLGKGFVKEKNQNPVEFAQFDNIDIPETDRAYELISEVEDIEEAVKLLLNSTNEQ